MPAAVQETNKVDHSEQMWKTLKAHILRERARKKQEREQEVEEERLRKERKAREQQLQQDVMTLGETREQISQLETRLIQLKEEKHQLFIQLKKVLNEDDSRRRQLIVRENPSENNEQMIAIQTLPSNMVHQQLFNIQQPSRLAPMPQQQQQNAFKTAIKRPRSPSPQPQVPVSLYHGYGYKPPTVGTPSYQSSPQNQTTGSTEETVEKRIMSNIPLDDLITEEHNLQFHTHSYSCCLKKQMKQYGVQQSKICSYISKYSFDTQLLIIFLYLFMIRYLGLISISCDLSHTSHK